MGPMFVPGDGESDLCGVVRWWLVSRPSWHLRMDQVGDQGLGLYFARNVHRSATVEEVADALLNDPQVRAALGALSSPAGIAIEQMILRLVLPDWQARLLAEGLARAWKVVLDENRPAWQRGEVLVGTVVVVGLLGMLASSISRGSN